MSTLQLSLNLDRARQQLGQVTKKEIALFRRSLRVTGDKFSSEIKRRGDADILRAGNFSSRWTDDFEAPVRHGDMRADISVGFKSIEYGHVHEFGATIRGRPLLWIPLSWTGITVRARDYPDQLFKVERVGKNPLLLSVADREPKYVGVTHVTLRPRFHIRSITANVVRTELGRMFFSVWKKGA